MRIGPKAVHSPPSLLRNHRSFPLFAWQGAQTQMGFRRRAWPVASNDMAELAWSTEIAARLHHRVEAAGPQRRELRQGLVDERQIRVDFRGAMELCQARQASLRQHPCDGVTVHSQLFGDRSDPPVFGVVIAQDLRLDVRGNGHGEVLFDCSTDLGSAAESHGEQTADSHGRSDGSAIAVGRLPLARILPPWPLPGPLATDHPIDPVWNPDASHYFCAPDGGVIVPHDWRGRDGSSDSGDWRRVRVAAWFQSAAFRAVQVAAIAMAADQYLHPATLA
jgi:hypothetical protein